MAEQDEEPEATGSRSRTPWRIAGVLSLGALWGVWAWIRPALTLPLGSLHEPTPDHWTFLKWYTALGIPAAFFLARGLEGRPIHRLRALLRRGSDTGWIAAHGLGALALAITAHFVVLQRMSITDDESAYLFAAQMVAAGEVSVPSPPDKEFWDRAFMYNAGTFYPQYFLGWPALLAPFALLGLPWLANPVYLALTVPAWFQVMRHAAGGVWARLGTSLLVLSPMVVVESGTILSHTSELCLVTWALWAALRAGDARAAWWTPAVLGLCIGGAFFNRPLTALALGLPFLSLWAYAALRGRRWRQLLAFLVPTVALALLFLLVNQWQNGAPTEIAYEKVIRYATGDDYLYSGLIERSVVAGFHLRGPGELARFVAIGVLRLCFAAFGWPTWMLLLPFLPLRRPAVRLHAAMVLSFFALHGGLGDTGVDTFGPAHLFELVLPATALFMAVGAEWQERGIRVAGLRPWPFLWAGILLSLTFYTPVRLLTVHAVTDSIRQAPDLTAHLRNAIVYVPYGEWAPQCESDRPRHHLFWRPNPRPDGSDPVLYANHLSVEEDRAHHARRFPERSAYLLHQENHGGTCSLRRLDLDSPEADEIPPGRRAEGR